MEVIREMVDTIVNGCDKGGIKVSDVLAAFIARTVVEKNSSSHKKENTIIYGLDADLIMLCLNHLRISKNIYLYRETPEFVKSIDRSINPNESYLLE